MLIADGYCFGSVLLAGVGENVVEGCDTCVNDRDLVPAKVADELENTEEAHQRASGRGSFTANYES